MVRRNIKTATIKDNGIRMSNLPWATNSPIMSNKASPSRRGIAPLVVVSMPHKLTMKRIATIALATINSFRGTATLDLNPPKSNQKAMVINIY